MKAPEGAKFAKVMVARPVFQGINVDLCGADDPDNSYLPDESYQFSNRAKRMMVNPSGFPFFPLLLDSDPEKTERERLIDNRHRPITEKQRKHQLARLLLEPDDNQAAEAQQEDVQVNLPKSREVRERKFTQSFGKEAKLNRVATARLEHASKRAAAVNQAHNDVAVVNHLESSIPRLQKMLDNMLYVFDSSSWVLRQERIQLLSLLTGVRSGMSKAALSQAIEDLLGPEIAELTDPDKKLTPGLKNVTNRTGTRKLYTNDDTFQFAKLHELSAALQAGQPLPERQMKSLIVLQRDEMLTAHARAQRLIEPDLPQVAETNDFGKAMPTADLQATAGQKKPIIATSPTKRPSSESDSWGGRGGRGTKTGGRGNRKRQYEYEQEDQAWQYPNTGNPKGRPKGKPKGKGKGKGKYGRARGRGRGK